MKLVTHIREGLNNLFSSKLRSILALIGILVGTASVVAMVSGGQLATNEALKQFKTLGTDLLAISISEPSGDERVVDTIQQPLTLSSAQQIIYLDHSVLEIAPYTQLYNNIQFEGHTINGSALGVTGDFARVVHIEMEKGRFISLLDGYGMYCVIGQQIYQAIKKHTFRDPIGAQIQLGKNIFTIVGVAKPWPESGFVYANIDYSLLIPITTSLALSKYASINNIILRLRPESDIEQVKNHLTQYLNNSIGHKNLYFRSAKELLAHMAKQSQILTIFLGLIGSISLIVGGIGVMNIMLVSIIERRREIGIRMAVGAKRSDIRSLFLVEAVMLALVGGVLGILIGSFIAFLIAFFSHWEFQLFLMPPLVGFSVSAVTGIFFGFYPAYKASQLDPIEALRSE